jgi:hypothetical protein
MKNKNAICVLTITPNIEFIEFYNNFKNYDIFFVIDDNNYNCEMLKKDYPSINFVQILNDECNEHGFKHSSYMPNSSLVFNEIISWDKALYFFSNINKNYEYVWFLEDDVFIYGEETIQNLDSKYLNSDILCRDKIPEPKENEWQWFWPAIHINFEKPYFQSSICAVRMSKLLLYYINKYIQINKKMFFIEAMFPTIAHKHNLRYDMPEEFSKIIWRNNWQQHDLNKVDFVHPIKNFNMHKEFRKNIL